jgi:hypothetical protein
MMRSHGVMIFPIGRERRGKDPTGPVAVERGGP